MKYGFYFILTLLMLVGAYQLAQTKINRPLGLESLKLGMSTEEVTEAFGTPSAESRNQFTYILHDGSELTITLRDQRVSSAKIKFHRRLKIQDPEMRKLSLVQMQPNEFDSNNASWFFAGKPEEGLIYKITSEGVIESLTWVPPFSYSSNGPKQLQALLQDFNSQRRL